MAERETPRQAKQSFGEYVRRAQDDLYAWRHRIPVNEYTYSLERQATEAETGHRCLTDVATYMASACGAHEVYNLHDAQQKRQYRKQSAIILADELLKAREASLDEMTIFKLKTVTTEKAPLIVCSDQEGVIFSRNEMNATYANAARTALLQTRWQLRHNGLLGTFDERLIGMLRRSRRLYRENMTRLDYSSLGSLPTLEETPAILSAREYLQKLQ